MLLKVQLRLITYRYSILHKKSGSVLLCSLKQYIFNNVKGNSGKSIRHLLISEKDKIHFYGWWNLNYRAVENGKFSKDALKLKCEFFLANYFFLNER